MADGPYCIFIEGEAPGMYCTKCGNKLPKNVKFCTRCGEPVTSAGKEEKAAPKTEPSEAVHKAKLVLSDLWKKAKPILLEGLKGIGAFFLFVGVLVKDKLLPLIAKGGKAAWPFVQRLWEKLPKGLTGALRTFGSFMGELWDRIAAKLPFRVSRKAALITLAVLVVVVSASVGGVARGGSSGSGGSTYIWSSSDSSSSSFSPRVNCVFCSGGKTTCTACSGSGGRYEYGSVANYSGSTTANTTTRTWQNCSKCHGSGEQTCTHCGGSGY